MAHKVTTLHADVSKASVRWQRCRDAYEGGDAVRERGSVYLPKLDAQSEAEYAAYKMRADFYGATARTVDGLAGAVLRKEPSIVAPEGILPHLKDVTSEGVPLEAFAKALVEQDLAVGRAGILVDLPTQAQAEARPYWVSYRAEQIVNWRTAVRNGRKVLVLVVLKETSTEQDGADPFVSKACEQYRVLQLVSDTPATATTAASPEYYTVTLYKKAATPAATTGEASKAEEFIAETPIIPVRRGERLPFIPFVFIGPTGVTADIEKPPLLDLVDLNLSHYRSSADLERGRFFTSSPTPYICGFSGAGVTPASPDNAEGHAPATPVYRIGSSVAWTFQDPQTKVGMLEYTGQGLAALRDALSDKQEQMSVLGARLLEAQKADAEAAATVRLRHAGDESVLKKITMAIDQALTQALRWHVWWAGLTTPDDQVSVTLNTDFMKVLPSADLLAKLLLMLQAGEISSKTLYHNLQRAEVTRPGVTYEVEHEDIDADSAAATPPALAAFAGVQPPPGDDDTGNEPDPQGGKPKPAGAPVDDKDADQDGA